MKKSIGISLIIFLLTACNTLNPLPSTTTPTNTSSPTSAPIPTSTNVEFGAQDIKYIHNLQLHLPAFREFLDQFYLKNEEAVGVNTVSETWQPEMEMILTNLSDEIYALAEYDDDIPEKYDTLQNWFVVMAEETDSLARNYLYGIENRDENSFISAFESFDQILTYLDFAGEEVSKIVNE